MKREGLSQVQLSARTQVGQSTISRILKPNGPKGIMSQPTNRSGLLRICLGLRPISYAGMLHSTSAPK
ncbi:helix-turn-helix domain-containing protein [Pseudomonas sp. NPDC090202]|uniref:helix-turn-helix domain-containing protein n=1 Tax=unclassified Pseudomonas TaxID=196821 RepID=UPI0038024298